MVSGGGRPVFHGEWLVACVSTTTTLTHLRGAEVLPPHPHTHTHVFETLIEIKILYKRSAEDRMVELDRT